MVAGGLELRSIVPTPTPPVRGAALRLEGAVLRVDGSGFRFEEPVIRLEGALLPLEDSVADDGMRIPPALPLLGSKFELELGDEGAVGSPEGVLDWKLSPSGARVPSPAGGAELSVGRVSEEEGAGLVAERSVGRAGAPCGRSCGPLPRPGVAEGVNAGAALPVAGAALGASAELRDGRDSLGAALGAGVKALGGANRGAGAAVAGGAVVGGELKEGGVEVGGVAEGRAGVEPEGVPADGAALRSEGGAVTGRPGDAEGGRAAGVVAVAGAGEVAGAVAGGTGVAAGGFPAALPDELAGAGVAAGATAGGSPGEAAGAPPEAGAGETGRKPPPPAEPLLPDAGGEDGGSEGGSCCGAVQRELSTSARVGSVILTSLGRRILTFCEPPQGARNWRVSQSEILAADEPREPSKRGQTHNEGLTRWS